VSTRGDLFRQEALELRTRGETSSGGVVRLGAAWLRWGGRLLLVLVAAGVAASMLVRTNESSTGPATVDGQSGQVSVLLPASIATQLRTAQGLRVSMSGSRSLRVRVERARAVSAGTRVRGLPAPSQPSLLLSGRIEPAGARLPPERVRGRATVVLRSERLAGVVAREFRQMIGLRR
jgi:hypothetical protein